MANFSTQYHLPCCRPHYINPGLQTNGDRVTFPPTTDKLVKGLQIFATFQEILIYLFLFVLGYLFLLFLEQTKVNVIVAITIINLEKYL